MVTEEEFGGWCDVDCAARVHGLGSAVCSAVAAVAAVAGDPLAERVRWTLSRRLECEWESAVACSAMEATGGRRRRSLSQPDSAEMIRHRCRLPFRLFSPSAGARSDWLSGGAEVGREERQLHITRVDPLGGRKRATAGAGAAASQCKKSRCRCLTAQQADMYSVDLECRPLSVLQPLPGLRPVTAPPRLELPAAAQLRSSLSFLPSCTAPRSARTPVHRTLCDFHASLGSTPAT